MFVVFLLNLSSEIFVLDYGKMSKLSCIKKTLIKSNYKKQWKLIIIKNLKNGSHVPINEPKYGYD